MLRPATPAKRQLRERYAKLTMVLTVPLLVLACIAAMEGPRWANYLKYNPAEGDVIFQSLPHSRLTDAIEGATGSPWSHCGIVARDERGRWVVYEALHGVEATPLRAFVARSRDDQYMIYRWKDDYQRHIPAMLRHVRQQLGKPYDQRYRLDDEQIYCSELVYKAFLHATGEAPGDLVALQDLQWKPFQKLIEELENGEVPLERQIITPRDLADSPQLSPTHRGPGPQ